MSEAPPISICICIPVDDGSRPQFWHSILNLVTNAGVIFEGKYSFQYLQNIGDSLITRARNNLAHDFLTQTDCEYMLFLDSDLEFQPDDIKRLVEKAKPDAVVCGQYAIKSPEFRMCRTDISGEVKGPDGLIKVAETGTGCMLIPRKILLALKDKHPALEYRDDSFKDQRVSFFDCGVIEGKDNSRYMSEDWLFCRRVREAGYAVYVDTTVLMLHWGWIAFPLPDDDLITALVSRCPTPEILAEYVADIDKAAKARWITLSQASSAAQ